MYKSLENKTKSRQFAIIICLLRKILMKLTTNPINVFQPIKRHDSVQHGRSMIEMLGVLAIIAVLSVGGIACYTKAIEMWKENNQIEQLNELFYNSIDNFDWFERDYFSNPITGYVKGGGMTILAGIDAIPYGMTVKNKILYDSLGNFYHMDYGQYNCPGGSRCPFTLYYVITLKQNNNRLSYTSEKQCKNIITVLRNFDNFIREMQFRTKEKNNQNYTISNIIYGKKHCLSGKMCFNNLTPLDIATYCKSCLNEVCYIRLEITPY